MSKSKKLKIHCHRRFIERLGYIPDFNYLVNQVKNNKLKFYKRQSNRVTLWEWTDPINNIECLLPYDKERKQIITILFKR